MSCKTVGFSSVLHGAPHYKIMAIYRPIRNGMNGNRFREG